MADDRAISVIGLWGFEEKRSVNFRTLYQAAADLIFPRENQIITRTTSGIEKTSDIQDETGVMAMQEMASGLSINLFPPGQRFYNIIMSDRRLNEIESVKRTLGQITELSHEKRFNSNFMLQANETLKSICTFGTGNLFSDYIPGIGLNYIDYDVGQYLIRENSEGRIDTVLIRKVFTARQATEKFENPGETVVTAMKEEQTAGKEFEFIYIAQPRKIRNPRLTNQLNMPTETLWVSVSDKVVVDEGGFNEFPHAIPRWTKASNETWGRGQGTFALPSVRQLQIISMDTMECGNKWNNPPLEVDESFEGEVKVFPGALNFVPQIGSIRAIEQGARGNFPISKEVMEAKQEQVRKLFFNDVFVQLANLKGDRRTTLEIRERLAEGLQRLGPPVGRLQEEWLVPLVQRDILLLMRNGELPPLPPEMQGASFKIEFVGRLAMELKSQQSQGFLRWVGLGTELQASFPGILDNARLDEGYRRLGKSLGVNVEDIATKKEVEGKREARQAAIEQEKALEIAQATAQGYSQTSKAPEEGSLAGELQNT